MTTGTLLIFGLASQGEAKIIPNVGLEDAQAKAMKWDTGRFRDNGNSPYGGCHHVWTIRAWWSPRDIVRVGNRTGWLGTPDAWTTNGEIIRWAEDAVEIRRECA